MADERVRISHPDIEGVGGPVSRTAFEQVWEPKGWRIVADDKPSKSTTKRARKTAAPTEEG